MLDVVKLDGNILCYKVFFVFVFFLHFLQFFSACVLSMSFQCMFAGSCWHLRRLDWCEDVGEPLMDEVSNCNEKK